MVSQKTINEIDLIIKEVWEKNIAKDYCNHYLLREDSLKCSFYYHLRRKLARLLRENNLRIYPEFSFSELGYNADIAIVQIDPNCEKLPLKNWVTSIVTIIEFKYAGGNSNAAANWIKSDVKKIKNWSRLYNGVK